ncbi:hypothetical protein BDQ12DRAFT_395813 [Crucibulum laeve]|uniref:Uncharacterized protein n=1 Tax=Crucibulum laeve TaxID=68775 RepID=A0A5C3MA64_9AGAR|nr:hypothetical protein BDQ12DRAFT_395813 [Crucibulum laeve]
MTVTVRETRNSTSAHFQTLSIHFYLPLRPTRTGGADEQIPKFTIPILSSSVHDLGSTMIFVCLFVLLTLDSPLDLSLVSQSLEYEDDIERNNNDGTPASSQQGILLLRIPHRPFRGSRTDDDDLEHCDTLRDSALISLPSYPPLNYCRS